MTTIFEFPIFSKNLEKRPTLRKIFENFKISKCSNSLNSLPRKNLDPFLAFSDPSNLPKKAVFSKFSCALGTATNSEL